MSLSKMDIRLTKIRIAAVAASMRAMESRLFMGDSNILTQRRGEAQGDAEDDSNAKARRRKEWYNRRHHAGLEVSE